MLKINKHSIPALWKSTDWRRFCVGLVKAHMDTLRLMHLGKR